MKNVVRMVMTQKEGVEGSGGDGSLTEKVVVRPADVFPFPSTRQRLEMPSAQEQYCITLSSKSQKMSFRRKRKKGRK